MGQLESKLRFYNRVNNDFNLVRSKQHFAQILAVGYNRHSVN